MGYSLSKIKGIIIINEDNYFLVDIKNKSLNLIILFHLVRKKTPPNAASEKSFTLGFCLIR